MGGGGEWGEKGCKKRGEEEGEKGRGRGRGEGRGEEKRMWYGIVLKLGLEEWNLR